MPPANWFRRRRIPTSSPDDFAIREAKRGMSNSTGQVLNNLLVRVAYQQRNTVHSIILTPLITADANLLSVANSGRDFYREFQITGRYQIRRHALNASYVRSKLQVI